MSYETETAVRNELLLALVEPLTAMGHKIETSTHQADDGRTIVNLKSEGILVSSWVDVKEMRAKGTSWRRGPSLGRFCASVGNYGDKRMYQKGKAGWRLDDIALDLGGRINRVLQERKIERARQDNTTTAKTLREDLKLEAYYGPMRVEASAEHERPVRVKLDWSANVTPSKAIEIHAALVALGVIVQK